MAARQTLHHRRLFRFFDGLGRALIDLNRLDHAEQILFRSLDIAETDPGDSRASHIQMARSAIELLDATR
jgi:hypothetical protein